MKHDDLDLTFDRLNHPVSIEEFAAYMDGNLSDDEMQRVSTVIEQNDMMQEVMDSLEQSELTLAEYDQENLQLPEDIADDKFDVPEINDHRAVGGGGNFLPFARVVACAAAPMPSDCSYDVSDEEEMYDIYSNHFVNPNEQGQDCLSYAMERASRMCSKIFDLVEEDCSSSIERIDDPTNESQINNYTDDADDSNDDNPSENER